MQLTTDNIKLLMQGQRVLLIEDDNDLALRLQKVFRMWGAKETVLKRCMNGDTWGGLDFLLKEGETFDLVCMDTMLPGDEQDLRECDDLKKQLEQIQEQITEIRCQFTNGDSSKDAEEELDLLRKRAKILSADVGERIIRNAGVTIINKWQDKMGEKSGQAWTPHVGVLFLTARQEQCLADEIKGFRQDIKWLTKPATERQIGTAAAELLTKMHQDDRPS